MNLLNTRLFDAFCCEWLKSRRSLAAWLIVVGAFFTPAIVTIVRLLHPESLPALYADPAFWTSLWRSSWESMAIFFLPMAAILATSLIVQIEVRNNAWKQVHVLPIGRLTIFSAKLAVIVLMLLQFVLLFGLGVYLSAVLPVLLVSGVRYPEAPLPLGRFLGDMVVFFIDSLPIIAAQYLMSLRFSSFLAPIGIGFLSWVGALAALSWPHADLVPYAYTMLDYLKDNPAARQVTPAAGLPFIAMAWFAALSALAYLLFSTRAHKG